MVLGLMVCQVLGLTPGRGNGVDKPPKCTEDEPTFGDPPGTRRTEDCPDGGGLFWEKGGTDYFTKIRSLFLKLGHLEDCGLNEDSCLALGGHFNLGTGQNGDGSRALFEPQIIRWISSLLANHFQPSVVIGFGWLGRLDEISKHWNHPNGLYVDWNSPKKIRFGADERDYHFRIWIGKNKKGDPVKVIGWPNHPRKRPFTSKPIWNRSLNRIPQLMNFEKK